MNPLTLEWLEKAEGDWITAQREFRARQNPNFDAACFHSQQTIEKILKAFLQEQGAAILRTHSLVELLLLCTNYDTSIALIQADIKSLEGYAARFRYPGQSANREEAKNALRAAGVIRRFLLERLK